jgi:hypothetical protein
MRPAGGRSDVRKRRHDPDAHAVVGTFDDRSSATDAVHGLAEQSVPADLIDVYVLDESGAPTRAVEVEDEAGVLRGALWGLAGGAAVGLLIVVLVATGVLVDEPVDFFTYGAAGQALRIIALTALAGVPLGGVLGLGHWWGRKKISVDEAATGSIMVAVTTDELTDVSRRVLERAGARDVRVGPGVAPTMG